MKHNRPRTLALRTSFLLSILALAVAPRTCEALDANDLDELAAEIAKTIRADFVSNKPANGKYKVAVFKFTDQNGKYDPNTMGNLGNMSASLLQDELKVQLSSNPTTGKYEVFNQYTIDQVFSATSTSQIGVFSPNTAQVRTACASAGIDVAVLARLKFDKIQEVQDNFPDPVAVEVNPCSVHYAERRPQSLRACDDSGIAGDTEVVRC
ncbi:MAG: hypothetical protein O3A00_07715 [Planctomycetota bacterium]|nr:hypothetical protein [Planctomycetota bacterium]